MPGPMRRTWRLLLAAVLMTQNACLFAAAGAGAAGGIYLTSRGAESLVERPVDQLATRTETVLSQRSVTVAETLVRKGGDEREYKGKTGNLDITVKLNRASPTSTRIEVTARRNLAEWDKTYAEELLAAIVAN